MAIQDYDAAVHHVGLGVDADNLKGLVTVGPHSKQLAAPVFEKPSDIGTDDLIGSRNHSVWTQRDYTGGEFQDDWGDPAMFAECVMMLPNPLGKSLQTCRPMNATVTGDAIADTIPVSMEVVDGALFVVFNNDTPRGRVYRYNLNDLGNPESENVSLSFLPSGKQITAAAWNQSAESLLLGSDEPEIHSFTWDDTAAAGSRLVHKNNLGIPDSGDPITHVSGLHVFGKMRLAATAHGGGTYDDNRLWIYVSGTGTNANWSKVGVLPGQFVDSVTYNNAVYILTRSGNARTQLSMTQGDQIFPVLDLPYAFRGWSMCEYAGRLYIAGVGMDINGNRDYGELYEVSGTSLRLVRTWAGEISKPDPLDVDNDNNGILVSGTGSWPTTVTYPSGPIDAAKGDTGVIVSGGITPPSHPPVYGGPTPSGNKHPHHRKMKMSHMRALVVADGLLWMPDSSWTGLEAYDATTDAFYGGARSRDGNDTDIEFTRLVSFNGAIIAWASSSDRTKQGLYVTEGRVDADAYYPYITTSDFSPEPSRDKVWSRCTILCKGSGTPFLDYSYDGGQYWFRLDADYAENIGYRSEVSWDLSGVPPSRSLRLRFTFGMPGFATEQPAELIAHSVSFLVRGDQKKRWTFTVNAAVGVGDIADDLYQQTPADVINHVWSMMNTDLPVLYRDVDGNDYTVLVSDVSENHPAIDEDGEAYLPVTLIEV